MKLKLIEKIKEAIASVWPVTLIVLILTVSVTPVNINTLVLFIIGAVLLVLGMALFTLGADMAMMPIGENVGSKLTKSKNPWLVAFFCFILGFIITIAEPDLFALAEQVQGIGNWTLILSVALGVGIFLVIAFLRIFLKVKLNYILTVMYVALFIMAFFVPSDFIAVAFDSGGVTTGPITVPFIMAFGIGLASMRSDDAANDDSFGLIAICSVGPILAVMILGLMFEIDGVPSESIIPAVGTSQDLFVTFVSEIPKYILEVGKALLPILLFFILFQIFSLKLRKNQLLRILVGIMFTFAGLLLFLVGVNVGFSPAGREIGELLAAKSYSWIIIPLGMLIGFFIVKAEPAVHVLNKRVEEITSGTISHKTMMWVLSIGMAISVGLAMIRVLFDVPVLYFLIPGYLIAILLSFFVPKIFTAIAFDSGGVASGPMTATFLLPMAIGACGVLSGSMMDAFGVVSMVAMTPLIAIQILGVMYGLKLRLIKKRSIAAVPEEEQIIVEDAETVYYDEIIDFNEESQPEKGAESKDNSAKEEKP